MSAARYVLAGDPIAHSPSPAMHNAGFAALGLNATYALRPTSADGAAAFLAELQRGALAGANVTTPIKTVVAALVPLVGAAARAQAVNTLYRDGGRLVGELTDVAGVREPLAARGVEGGEALLLGAGGAARAAAVALDELGLVVHVAARRVGEAERLLAVVLPSARGRALGLGDTAALVTLLPQLRVLVQATPVGRQGERLPLPWDAARPGLIAFEMLYRPRQTPFLQDARAASATPIEGWEMLLHQGLRSFELWTGKAAPRPAMQQALERALAQP